VRTINRRFATGPEGPKVRQPANSPAILKVAMIGQLANIEAIVQSSTGTCVSTAKPDISHR